jgi:c-di-GMP-binding flagellar brake protein YcgR
LFSKQNDEPLIVCIDDDRRGFFRVEPPSGDPLWVKIENRQYRVKDIGAGGIGIYRKQGEGEIEAGKTYPFHITLPLLNEVITGTLKAVNRSDEAYHCAFIALSEEKREMLHLFVLEMQKEQLREAKSD